MTTPCSVSCICRTSSSKVPLVRVYSDGCGSYFNYLSLSLSLSLFLPPSLPLGSSASEDRTVVDKFEGEEAMLKRYAIHMKLLESFKKLLPGSSWRELMDSPEAQEDSKVHYFSNHT